MVKYWPILDGQIHGRIFIVKTFVVVETGDTNEDTEARALLNKFLGASVILHGMEQGAKSPTSSSTKTTTSSALLVNQVEKQRAQVCRRVCATSA